ncbi:tRNA (cytidine(34)-2'-O)-methyltransferase [Stomatobaculum longum]|uniref:tRNA (cytidine(34)-2'-O)-methyltransferase n=1 Tax=Stomatobaculum longum TaxID=796942 RepID=UPI003C706317
MNIVLHEPEIPFNTGAIGRTCVATNTALHLIKPYGFFLGDKYLKRAGMDYWQKLSLREYDDYAAFLAQHPELSFGQKQTGRKLWFATTKAEQTYADVSFGPDDYIMFGKESAGIPEEILAKHREACIRIPMWGDIRSLNLSNAVAVILYEALRQQDFAALEKQGALHRLHWETETEY